MPLRAQCTANTLCCFSWTLESGQSVIAAMVRDQVHCVPEYCLGERLREYAFVRVISQILGPISVRKHIGVSH